MLSGYDVAALLLTLLSLAAVVGTSLSEMVPCNQPEVLVTRSGDYLLDCPNFLVKLFLGELGKNTSSLNVSFDVRTPFLSLGWTEVGDLPARIDDFALAITLSLSFNWTSSEESCSIFLNSSKFSFGTVSIAATFNGTINHTRQFNNPIMGFSFFADRSVRLQMRSLPGSHLEAKHVGQSGVVYIEVDGPAVSSVASLTAENTSMVLVNASLLTVKRTTGVSAYLCGVTATMEAQGHLVSLAPTPQRNFSLNLTCVDTRLAGSKTASVVQIDDDTDVSVCFVSHHTLFVNSTVTLTTQGVMVGYPPRHQSTVTDRIVNCTLQFDQFAGWIGCTEQQLPCGPFATARCAVTRSDITIGGTSSWYSGPFENVVISLESNSSLLTRGTATVVAQSNPQSLLQGLAFSFLVSGASRLVVVDQPPNLFFLVGFSLFVISPMLPAGVPTSFTLVRLDVTGGSILSFARRLYHNESVGWLVSAGSQQSALAVDQLLVTIEGSTVVTPLSSWRLCAGPSSRLPRLPHMFSVDVAARSVGVSVEGSVIALVSAAAPDRVVLSLPMSVPRSFAAADARWADDGPLVPGNCTRTLSLGAPAAPAESALTAQELAGAAQFGVSAFLGAAALPSLVLPLGGEGPAALLINDVVCVKGSDGKRALLGTLDVRWWMVLCVVAFLVSLHVAWAVVQQRRDQRRRGAASPNLIAVWGLRSVQFPGVSLHTTNALLSLGGSLAMEDAVRSSSGAAVSAGGVAGVVIAIALLVCRAVVALAVVKRAGERGVGSAVGASLLPPLPEAVFALHARAPRTGPWSVLAPAGRWEPAPLRSAFGPLFASMSPAFVRWRWVEAAVSLVGGALTGLAVSAPTSSGCQACLSVLAALLGVACCMSGWLRPYRLPFDRAAAPCIFALLCASCALHAAMPPVDAARPSIGDDAATRRRLSAASDALSLAASVLGWVRLLMSVLVAMQEGRWGASRELRRKPLSFLIGTDKFSASASRPECASDAVLQSSGIHGPVEPASDWCPIKGGVSPHDVLRNLELLVRQACTQAVGPQHNGASSSSVSLADERMLFFDQQ